VDLGLTLSGLGQRMAAFLLDCLLMLLVLIVGSVLAFLVFKGAPRGGGWLIQILWLLGAFALRNLYFILMEMGPRAATYGKRLCGIRVVARSGARLTADAVIARNLMRDVEVFMPIAFLSGGVGDWGVTGSAVLIWLAVFVLFPFFNRDHLRAGDLIAGTWVVEAERHKLMEAMSLARAAPPTSYAFGEAELSVYGEHELQVLEGVLRQDNAEAQRQVTEAICRKIGWQPGAGDERAFLEAFYAALRARLEQNMRFGQRKKDKFAQ
jgi:uncharacterized RDD family membrane protein YckC